MVRNKERCVVVDRGNGFEHNPAYCREALPEAKDVCEDCIVGESCIQQTESAPHAWFTAHLLPSLQHVFVMLRNPLQSEWRAE